MPTSSALQRRQRARVEYNAFLATCPSRQLLDRLADKWVIKALADGPQRYGELSRTIAGVSQKMLTQTLRSLERDGLVVREVTPSVPVRVDYQLTDLGVSLLPLLSAIVDWAERHMDTVNSARQEYDRAS